MEAYPTRRNLLTLFAAGPFVAGSGLLASSKSDFWNRKEPDQWSSDEKRDIVTRSPWAKEVSGNAGRAAQNDPGNPGAVTGPMGVPGGMGGNSPGMGGPGVGGMGGGGMGGAGGLGGRGRNGQPAPMTGFRGTVRWESAKPVLMALKLTLPQELQDHYVIAVSGFPLGAEDRDLNGAGNPQFPPGKMELEQLKGLTTLRVKGKRPAQPGIVQRGSDSDGPVVWFGFSHDAISIQQSDKNASFDTEFGPLSIGARFDLRQMMYHGEMAL